MNVHLGVIIMIRLLNNLSWSLWFKIHIARLEEAIQVKSLPKSVYLCKCLNVWCFSLNLLTLSLFIVSKHNITYYSLVFMHCYLLRLMNISAVLSACPLWTKVIVGETSVQVWMPLLKEDIVKTEKLQRDTTKAYVLTLNYLAKLKIKIKN